LQTKRKLYKGLILRTLQSAPLLQRKPTAGHVTRLSVPVDCVTRKQNWKLHALIPVVILQCLRKINQSLLNY